MIENADKIVDKLDGALAQVAKALVDATNQYGPDVAAYTLKTVYFDAVQFFVGFAIAMTVALAFTGVGAGLYRKGCKMYKGYHSKSYADPTRPSHDGEIYTVFGVGTFCISQFGFWAALIAMTGNMTYPLVALLGDPKIVLTKRILERML